MLSRQHRNPSLKRPRTDSLTTSSAPGPSATLEDWLDYHQRLNPRRIELGLGRTRAVLDALELERPDLTITVAGTNGKGSSVAMLDALLREPRKPVGAFTSPHLIRYNERIALDGAPVDDATIIAAFQRIEAVRGDVPLTYFEASALAALAVFADAGVAVALLEVGLGGRLDAVNAVSADGMLITSIDLDHQSWLGDTREAIGAEKAGVLRGGAPAVFSGNDMPDSVAEVAAQVGTPLWVAGRDYSVGRHRDGHWQFESALLTLVDLPPLTLTGDHQIANAAGVIALLARLGRLPDDAADRLSRVAVAGRFQRLSGRPPWILDVAHNPASAAALAATLRREPCQGRTLALVGMLADKDLEAAIGSLDDVVDDWFAMPIESPRALPPLDLAQRIAAVTNRPCAWFDAQPTALQAVRELANSADRIVVFGSFHAVGPALATLRGRRV